MQDLAFVFLQDGFFWVYYLPPDSTFFRVLKYFTYIAKLKRLQNNTKLTYMYLDSYDDQRVDKPYRDFQHNQSSYEGAIRVLSHFVPEFYLGIY